MGSTSTGSGAESAIIGGLAPGQDYQFRVKATESAYGTSSLATAWLRAKTRDAIKGNLSPVISLGVPFNYQILVTNAAPLTSLEVTGLPESLTFNSEDGTITGTLYGDASYDVIVTATFSDGSASERILKLRTIAPPVVKAAFDPQSVAVLATKMVSVVAKFSDPDTESAARFETTKEQFDIILFPTGTPLTVNNFLAYIEAGKYDNSFFHRSPDNFVVQGGGYKYTVADGFTEIAKLEPVSSEPGISNLRGTVAMAKIGGDPDSATSEWFVNIKDNSGPPPALDTQNGGFTVFGRVPESGMTLFQAINDLPVATYEFPLSLTPKTLDNVPVDAETAPPALDPTTLVKIITVGPAPILTYAVTSLNIAVATASISGTDITISGVGSGSTSIEVTATDLDGQSVTENIQVTVP
jgi:cyclophilin family peptidyl-prolyl cis-trans isomerase